MTDSDLRELDGWIAEHVFGKTICPGEYDHILTDDNTVLLAPSYSSDLAAFALVKREIERRKWSWLSGHDCDAVPKFKFEIWRNPGTLLGYEHAESEELAGCLAVKAAVEGAMDSAKERDVSVEESVTGLPILDADVWITSDLSGKNVIWAGTSDADGLARDPNGDKPKLDPGSYFVWVSKPGWASEPQELVFF